MLGLLTFIPAGSGFWLRARLVYRHSGLSTHQLFAWELRCSGTVLPRDPVWCLSHCRREAVVSTHCHLTLGCQFWPDSLMSESCWGTRAVRENISIQRRSSLTHGDPAAAQFGKSLLRCDPSAWAGMGELVVVSSGYLQGKASASMHREAWALWLVPCRLLAISMGAGERSWGSDLIYTPGNLGPHVSIQFTSTHEN